MPHKDGRVPFAVAVERDDLFAALEPVRALIASDPALQPTGAPGEVVRADLRVRPGPDGACAIERLYWSVQRADPNAPGGLRGRMLVVDRRLGRGPDATVHDFPDDPRLPAAARPAGPLGPGPGGAAVQVLRYVPLARITFRTASVAAGGARIGKIKAPRGLERAEARMVAVCAAASAASFGVAEPLGIDREQGVLYQSVCPGLPLPEVARRSDAEATLRRFGEIHREIHGLDIDAPLADETQLREDLRAGAAWIATAVPRLGGAARRLADWIEANLRYCPPAERVFCHGDYSPAQLLCDGRRWAVVDFDDAHLGDPYAEIASVLVSIEQEAGASDPAEMRRRRAAYLSGYGGPFDRERLLAHEARERLGLLAKRLGKDRAAPGEPDRVLAALLERTGA